MIKAGVPQSPGMKQALPAATGKPSMIIRRSRSVVRVRALKSHLLNRSLPSTNLLFLAASKVFVGSRCVIFYFTRRNWDTVFHFLDKAKFQQRVANSCS